MLVFNRYNNVNVKEISRVIKTKIDSDIKEKGPVVPLQLVNNPVCDQRLKVMGKVLWPAQALKLICDNN